MNWFKKYIWDLGMMILVLLLPFTLYLHLLFDKNSTLIYVFGYPYKHDFIGNDEFIWQLFLKIIPILLFVIWFLNTLYSWRYFILAPLLIFVFGLIGVNLFWVDFLIQISFIIIFLALLLLFDSYVVVNIRRRSIKFQFSHIFITKTKWVYDQIANLVFKLKNHQSGFSSKGYLGKLFHAKKMLYMEINQGDLDFPYVTRLKKGFMYTVVILLLSVPLLFNVYRLVPQNITVLHFDFFTLGSYGFPSLYIFLWLFCNKLCILIPLSIWFVTCQHWWKFAILSPIILFSYQTWEIFQDGLHIDALGNLRAFPFVIGIVLLLIILSRITKYRFRILDLHESISTEIEGLLQQLEGSAVETVKKQRWQTMIGRDATNEENKKTRVSDLQRLKKEIEIEIKKLNNK